MAAAALLALAALVRPAAATVEVQLDIRQSRWELRPGLTTTAWTYNGVVPGTPIVARVGDRMVIEARNRLPAATNIHWHGLEVPNDQDGPAVTIDPGGSHRYEFVLQRAGTYWYHAHHMPVLPQVDRGLYGPLVVLAAEDAAYTADHVLVLDDWLLGADGRRLEGSGAGEMERIGNVETVNGKTGDAVEPLTFTAGGLYKLRFVNASTAAVHTLRIAGHRFRVTHLDGHGRGPPLVRRFDHPFTGRAHRRRGGGRRPSRRLLLRSRAAAPSSEYGSPSAIPAPRRRPWRRRTIRRRRPRRPACSSAALTTCSRWTRPWGWAG